MMLFRLTRLLTALRAFSRQSRGTARFSLVVAGLGSTLASASTLEIDVLLRDPDFPPPGPYRLEILETGDTARIHPGSSLRMPVPRDSSYLVCLRGAADSTGGYLEKCYPAKGSPADSVWGLELVGDKGEAIVVAEPDSLLETADSAEVAADSTLSDLAGGEATQAEEGSVQLKKVVVRAQRRPKRAMGRQTVSAKLIKRMPGLAEADVIRSIQGLPGVVASSDFSTKIYVRGGGSDQNLILLDQAPVFSPVHFFGLFSTFLVEGIDDVTFYKGGFPSEYGNRLSSVLDIKSRKGGNDTADTWFKGSSVKITTIASSGHVEGHQGPVRWLAAGRTTYIKQVVDFLRDRGAIDIILDYYFYDAQGSVAYTPDANSELLVSFYQGRDQLDFDPFFVEWGNSVFPVNYRRELGPNWTSRTHASYSLMSQTFGLESIFEFYNRIATLQGKQTFEYRGIDNHRLSFGFEGSFNNVVFRNSQPVAKVEQRDETDYEMGSVFVQDKWTWNNLETTPGLRLTRMSTLGSFDLEPRLSLKYSLPARQSLDAHVGYYRQYINSIIFGDQETVNEFYYPAKKVKYRTVNPTTSVLMALGYGIERFLDTWDFSLEGYYKSLNHLLVFADTEIDQERAQDLDAQLGDNFKEAEGYSLGYEVSLRKPEGMLFGGLSYSQGYSVILEQGRDNPYWPRWHQPHSFKGDLAINWRGDDGIWKTKRKGRYFRSSTQLKFATGLPYTRDIGYMPGHLMNQNEGRNAGGPNPEYQDNIDLQKDQYLWHFVPSYVRWDIKPVDWGQEGKWNFSFTILNVTNHENVFLYTYDNSVNPPKRETIPQFPFFPFLLSYEYQF